MLQSLPKTIKAVLVLIGVLAVMGLIYSIYTAVNRSGKIEAIIDVVPGDARVTLNGVAISPGTIFLEPGNYTVQATREGFSDFNGDKYIDETSALVTVLLTPESQEASSWAQQNQDKYLEAEGRAGETANKEGLAFLNKNPITGVLPYRSLLYAIGYKADPDDPTTNSIIITIDASEGYRNAAIEQIRNLGYDPTNFKIEFKNYRNPFES